MENHSANYEIYIIDYYMKPVPIGAEGRNIYIGRKGICNGFLD